MYVYKRKCTIMSDLKVYTKIQNLCKHFFTDSPTLFDIWTLPLFLVLRVKGILVRSEYVKKPLSKQYKTSRLGHVRTLTNCKDKINKRNGWLIQTLKQYH